MIVMKFGGTSVQDASAIGRVVEIVRADPRSSKVIVVSALAGVTNALLDLARSASTGETEEIRRTTEDLRRRHNAVARELLPPPDAERACRQIAEIIDTLDRLVGGVAIVGETSSRTIDAFASAGEDLSSLLVTAACSASGIPASFLDARTYMITDEAHTHARPELAETKARLAQRLLPPLKRGDVVVTQGFIGATRGGVTTTLGRGGSDYSAAIIGSLLPADEIQIWTDVDGILTADPSLVPEARNIGAMSFREASELAYFGARVLHPDTILPAITAGIPVIVRNSRRPELHGTTITEQSETSSGSVKSIAYKEGVSLISIVSARMFLAHGFLARVFDVFDRHRTVVHAVASSEVSITAAIDDTAHVPAIVGDLSSFASVNVAHGKAIVCVVGEGLAGNAGIAARLLSSAGDVEVHMISQGASEMNIGFVIDESMIARVVRSLHAAFFLPAAEKEAA